MNKAGNKLGTALSKILLISGPSGVGKGTVVSEVMRSHPNVFELSVSSTTRPRRSSETAGSHYHFHSKQEFEEQIRKQQLLEWVQFDDNYYGTLKSSLASIFGNGRIPLLELEIQGAVAARANGYDGLYIYLKPPSMEELERRIRKRGQNTEESIARRMRKARDQEDEFLKHSKAFDVVVVNESLPASLSKINELVSKRLLN